MSSTFHLIQKKKARKFYLDFPRVGMKLNSTCYISAPFITLNFFFIFTPFASERVHVSFLLPISMRVHLPVCMFIFYVIQYCTGYMHSKCKNKYLRFSANQRFHCLFVLCSHHCITYSATVEASLDGDRVPGIIVPERSSDYPVDVYETTQSNKVSGIGPYNQGHMARKQIFSLWHIYVLENNTQRYKNPIELNPHQGN